MSHPPIIDAGPGLNFFSINKERLLVGVLGPLSAPESVRDEVFRKSRQDERFRAAAAVWRKLTPTWMQVQVAPATGPGALWSASSIGAEEARVVEVSGRARSR